MMLGGRPGDHHKTMARNCWASSLNDCSGKLSHEHLVSRALFDGPTIQVNAPWTGGQTRSIGLNRLTGNILCKGHNSRLSPVDVQGATLFRTVRIFDSWLAGKLADDPERIRRIRIDGPMLERWFAKTAINLFISTARDKHWPDKGAPSVPPRYVVDAIFGKSRLAPPMGLHFLAGQVADTRVVADQVRFTPLFRDGTCFVAGHFEFQAMHFAIWFDRETPAWHNTQALFRHLGGPMRDEATGKEGHIDITWPPGWSPHV